MTQWKDILPEYEPGKDSWKKLEGSLRLDEQLRRTVPELPAYEPQEDSWDGITVKLPGRTRHFTRYSGIAAAMLVLIVAGILFFRKMDEIRRDQAVPQSGLSPSGSPGPSKGPAARNSTPSRNAHGNLSGDVDPDLADNSGKPGRSADSPGITLSATGIASGSTGVTSHATSKIREEEKGEANKSGRANKGKKAAESGGVKSERDRLMPQNTSETPEIALLPEAAGNLVAEAAEKPVPGEAGKPVPGEGANAAKPATAPSLSPKVNKGRHRVIRIDWESPEESGRVLVRLPEATPDERENSNDNYPIKIKL